MKTQNNIKNYGLDFTAHLTAILTDNAPEISEVKDEVGITNVASIYWVINSAGYVTLEWEMLAGEPKIIAYLAGNGRWELGVKEKITKPEGSTGRVRLSTHAFVANDSYTIIYSGKR